jgi:ribosomal protein L34
MASPSSAQRRRNSQFLARMMRASWRENYLVSFIMASPSSAQRTRNSLFLARMTRASWREN